MVKYELRYRMKPEIVLKATKEATTARLRVRIPPCVMSEVDLPRATMLSHMHRLDQESPRTTNQDLSSRVCRVSSYVEVWQ
jgi:hypothetical protein